MKIYRLITIFLLVLSVVSCKHKVDSDDFVSNVDHPMWVRSGVVYEVNIRQYTPEGTINAFSEHLERLQSMGVGILWLMPIHPIGEVDRKGTLGSYYSVKDYKAINPEFGTMADFKKFLDKAHKMGFKVIIDWVANHTSRDHRWIKEHPEWYMWDDDGNVMAPHDWTDVAKLNYEHQELRDAMIDNMLFWIDLGVDGFRCDVAAEVTVEFWEDAALKIRKRNPDLFMLAEAEEPSLQVNAFSAYYAWSMHHVMNDLAQGKITVTDLVNAVKTAEDRFPKNTIALNFTSNHDENSWNGSEFERMGDAAGQFAVFTFVIPGVPLIYTGQEIGLDRSLEFFEKDPIDPWVDRDAYTKFYRGLIEMRQNHPVLWVANSEMTILETNHPNSVFAFQRVNDREKALIIFNFAKEGLHVVLKKSKYFGKREYDIPVNGHVILFEN